MMALRTVLILRCLAERGLEGRKGVDPAYLTILAPASARPEDKLSCRASTGYRWNGGLY